MKKILLTFALILFAEAFAKPDFELVSGEHSLTFFPEQAGKVLSFYCRNNDGQPFHGIQIWQDDSTGELISLLHLSNFSEAAGREMALLKEPRTEDLVKLTIGRMVGTYLFSYNDLVFDEPILERFSNALEAQVEKEKFQEIISLLKPFSSSFDENSWEVTFFIITGSGAIEKRKVSGIIDPFAVNKKVIEVLAPVGFVPDISFVP